MRIQPFVVSTVLIGLFWIPSGSARATTYLIQPDGTGDFPTIQAALAAAGTGDEILLADGTFLGSGNVDLHYDGKTVTVRSQSLDPTACIIDCQGSEANPHRGVFFHDADGPGAVLQGVTIANGYTSENLNGGGGGIRCHGGGPTILNCIVQNCTTSYLGGGVKLDGSDPTFRHCIFRTNTAFEGGGVCSYEGGTATFEDCSFTSNQAWVGGGLNLLGGAAAVLTRCRFVENISRASSGAVGGSGSPSASFTDCVFLRNDSGSDGGALGWYGSDEPSVLTLRGCTIAGNLAGYTGRSFVPAPLTTVTVEGCTFYDNAGLAANGIEAHAPSTTVRLRNTIIAEGRGGVPVAISGLTEISCCDFFGNGAGDWVGPLEPYLGVDGNIQLDPNFCDAEQGDLTLDLNSPCAPFSPPNPECDLIGAWPVGCGATPTITVTWGGIKHRFARSTP